LQSLTKRRELIRDQEFAEAGDPSGSGCVERANKVVLQARMNQAGMRWARGNVNPMAAWRKVACNDRWKEAWAQIATQLQQERMIQRLQKHPQPMPTRQEAMAEEIKRKETPLPEAT